MARFVKFPGTAGSYASTDDVNLLDCDSSWFAQGTGGLWTVGTPSTEQAWINTQSLKVLAGATTAITPATDAAFFSLYVYSAAGDTFDINGSTPVAAPAGVWTRIKEAGPDGTYTVTAVGAADYYIDGVIVQATDATFVPSLRIVGDLEMYYDGTVTDWAALNGVMSKAAANAGYQLFINGVGSVISYAGNGADNRQNNGAVTGFVAGTRHTIKSTFTVSTGAWDVFYDDVSQGGQNLAAGAIAVGDKALFAGSDGGATVLNGDCYLMYVSDGIGGPVVASFDPDDVPTI